MEIFNENLSKVDTNNVEILHHCCLQHKFVAEWLLCFPKSQFAVMSISLE